ncbi:MAG: aldehyde dehydrogenase family protein [Gemmataceae bacterium]
MPPAPHAALHIGRRSFSGEGEAITVRSPIDGAALAEFPSATTGDLRRALTAANEAFLSWRTVPGPVRGEFVRRIGERLRARKQELAAVVCGEAGKIMAEAAGEVQEMIDICDFAVGLSRQLYGLTIASERPGHRLMEQWHPLGPIGVISAFNFPVAVWAWNAMIGLVCGDPIVWKPSPKSPLSALASHAVVKEVLDEMTDIPDGVACLVIGGTDVGVAMADAPELPLLSATGSCAMGRAVAQRVAARLGRSLLELGGNNAMIVAPSADLEMAIRSITFAAAGTCGQRCTTLRRLIVHESIASDLTKRLKAVFAKLPIGDPRESNVLVGPLIDGGAFERMQTALAAAKKAGGVITGGERVTSGVPANGYYVRPAIVEIDSTAEVVREETFAPILYVMKYRDFADAIRLQNNVPHGLASSVLTNDVREAELFVSPAGSDCGIANINIGTSGAEIGGAFGGEKDTGGGRESGTDSWKAYMRRATNTINYSRDLPLAQGIKFDVATEAGAH